jgi:hypothetical protein
MDIISAGITHVSYRSFFTPENQPRATATRLIRINPDFTEASRRPRQIEIDDNEVIAAQWGAERRIVMKSIIRHSLMVAGAALVLTAAASTQAYAFDTVTVKVPFAFNVENRTLPAGQYIVQRADQDPSVLVLRGVKGTHGSAVVLTDAAPGRDPEGSKPCLTFSRVGNTHQLSGIWESGTEGRTVLGAE